MKKIINKISIAIMVFALPFFVSMSNVSAATNPGVDSRGIVNLLQQFQSIIAMIVPLLIALALIAFLWGVLTYLFKKKDGKDDAKEFMIWGIIALFVMTSVWGLVTIVRSSLIPSGSNSLEGNIPVIPTFRTQN